MISVKKSETAVEADLKRIRLLNYKVSEYRVEEAWKRFENAGFKPLLIKGWAAAQYYDEPADRRFDDVDLAFDHSEYEGAVGFLKNLEGSTAIDLHDEVRHLDTLDFKTLYANSQLIKCRETEIRVLCAEDHLRVLCVHWLIDGAAKKDKLYDIYYLLKNRPADFDWDRCLNVVSQNRRRWILCTIGLAHKYLGLEVADMPFAESIEAVPGWLIKAVEKEWQSETFVVPLHFVLNDWGSFWKQIKKRVPPNPIQATVEMEGSFDDGWRIYYQIGNTFQRLMPSVTRIIKRKRK